MPIGMSFDPDVEDDAGEATLGATTHCLLLPCTQMNLHAGEPRRTTQLDIAAKKLGMPLKIVRPDGTSLPDRGEHA